MSLVLGENIRAARREAELRQEDLAELIGVTQGALSQFEKGKTPPSSETFQKIRKELQKCLGESRLNFYLPKILSHLTDAATNQRLSVRAAGAEIKSLGSGSSR